MTLLKYGAPGHRHIYTEKACAAPRAIYTTEACAASGCVYNTPQRHVLYIDMSILCTKPVLHLDVSTQKRPELHLDLSTLQRPVLLLEVFTLQRP
jgi:hypothetical protein